MMRLLTSALVAAWLALPLAAMAQQQPSLAEIARKEQERRKGVKAPAKVYTDKDVKQPARPAGEAPLPPAVATPPTPVPEQKPDQKTDQPKDQAWWKGRMDQAREELRRGEMFAEALQTRINSLTADFVNRDDPFQRAKVGDDRQKALAEMERVKGDVERFKKQITDIEEEARQAGVPPGWLR